MAREVPDLETVQDVLRPAPALEARIRAFLDGQLGRVLPPDPERGLRWYYDWVVLGRRSLEAFAVFASHRDDSSSLPVLDVGSGLGTFVLLANNFGIPAVGVEPGAHELELARERQAAIAGLAAADLFTQGVGEAMPYADGSFSGVLLHDVLEHVGDWRAVLAEVRRVCAPGAVVYIKGPNYAVRFSEPHYRVPWLPLMPKPLARRYLGWLGRDTDYLEHLGWRRRGQVLAELRALGFELAFPRIEKLARPQAINRPWVRRLAGALSPDGPLGPLGRRLAENPLQAAIDVVGRVPSS